MPGTGINSGSNSESLDIKTRDPNNSLQSIESIKELLDINFEYKPHESLQENQRAITDIIMKKYALSLRTPNPARFGINDTIIKQNGEALYTMTIYPQSNGFYEQFINQIVTGTIKLKA